MEELEKRGKCFEQWSF